MQSPQSLVQSKISPKRVQSWTSHIRSHIFEDLGGNVYGNGTYVRSDKTSHVLTDTSLQFVISFRSYFSICDYGVSNRCDSNESYAPNSMYDYRTLRAASAQNNSKNRCQMFGILLAFFAEYNINYFSKLPKSKKFLLLTIILLIVEAFVNTRGEKVLLL